MTKKLQELIEEIASDLTQEDLNDGLYEMKIWAKHALTKIAQLAEEEERKRILKEVKDWQEIVRQEAGSFKYDFVFEGVNQLISNQKEDA